ncbi:putative phage abortive infection protein [Pseudomonas sp. H1_A05]
MILKGVRSFVVFLSNWLFAVVIVVVVVLGYMLFFDFLTAEIPIRKLPSVIREGTFGDSFGTLNALFSGLAFCGVLITLLLQRRDLFEVRKQSSYQQIESQFYNMLTLQHSVVQSFDLKRNGEVTMTGRDCFKTWYRFLDKSFCNNASCPEGKLKFAHDQLWLKYQGDLSLYFRSLYSVFRFVSDCSHEDKAKFGIVVRSFLSDFELAILFYNCLSERGKKFKLYACEFAVFNNLDHEMLLDKSHIVLLDKRAYGNNEDLLKAYEDAKQKGALN